MANPLEGAERTAAGRVVIYSLTTGNRYERQEDQALQMVGSGEFSTERVERTADTHNEAMSPAALVAPLLPLPVKPKKGK